MTKKGSTNLSKTKVKEKSDELFINSPKGTKLFQFTKKVRRIAKRRPHLYSLYLMKFAVYYRLKMQEFKMHAEIERKKIILEIIEQTE